MKTNKLDKKANTIAMQLGKEASFPADRAIETSIKEHDQTFFKDIQTENSDISFVPPWDTGHLIIRHRIADFFFLWSAEPKEEDILYTIDLYHKTGEKPMMYEFGVEYITSQRRSDLLIEGDVITIRTPYAIALERMNRKEDISPYLHSYIDDLFGDILATFFRTIAWFNYLMEHPDHKQIKKTPSGVEMNGLRITADTPTLKKIRSKQIRRVCTLWTVSGHIRHYKNGKTVYIKPYLKGKNRKAYQHEH